MVIEGDTESVRGAIAEVEGRLGFRLHYADLRSRQRRMAALAALDEIADWDGYLFETGRPLPNRHYSEHHVRAKTLAAALTLLGRDLGITSVVLETRAAPKKGFTELDEKDHQVLQKLLTQHAVPQGLRISHADKDERILAVADLVAGARSDYLCKADLEAYPLIAHRIRTISKVFEKGS